MPAPRVFITMTMAMMSPLTLTTRSPSWPLRPLAWYNANNAWNDANTTRIVANNGNVGTLRDLSGRNNHLLVSGTDGVLKTNALHSRPAIADNAKATAFTSTSAVVQAQPCNLWLVVQQTNGLEANNVLTSGSGWQLSQDAESNLNWSAGGTGFTVDATATVGTFAIVRVLANGSGSKLFVAGAETDGGSAGDSAGLSGTLELFGPNNFGGQVAELVIFGNVSATQATVINNVLKSKYGL